MKKSKRKSARAIASDDAEVTELFGITMDSSAASKGQKPAAAKLPRKKVVGSRKSSGTASIKRTAVRKPAKKLAVRKKGGR